MAKQIEANDNDSVLIVTVNLDGSLSISADAGGGPKSVTNVGLQTARAFIEEQLTAPVEKQAKLKADAANPANPA